MPIRYIELNEINLFIFEANSQKMQRLQTFLQQLNQPQNNDDDNWCGRGGGIANTSCPTNEPMACYKEIWKLDNQMSKRFFNSIKWISKCK